MQYTVFQYFLNLSVTPRALQMDVDYAHQNQEMLHCKMKAITKQLVME